MSKPKDKNKNFDSEIIDEVIKKVRAKKKASKKPRNLMLNVETWKEFEALCEQDKVWPSEVLDDFISAYLSRRRD